MVMQFEELRALPKKLGFVSFWACLEMAEPTGGSVYVSVSRLIERNFSQERDEVYKLGSRMRGGGQIYIHFEYNEGYIKVTF